MEILSGEQAHQALVALGNTWQGPLALAADAPPSPQQSVRCLAIASPEQAVLLHPHSTPHLLSFIAHRGVFAAYDAKNTHRMFLHAGIHTPERWACVKLTEQLVASGEDADLSLESVVKRHTGSYASPYSSAVSLGAHAIALARTLHAQSSLLTSLGLQHISKIESAAVRCVAMIEHYGMAFDLPLWKHLRTQHEKTPRYASFFSDSFEKAYGTDNRLHAVFEQIGASTGRMACRSPNIQAVSKEPWIRACFKVNKPRCLVRADYAGCELRILAQLSGDAALCAALSTNADIHAQVASVVFKQHVTKESAPDLRQKAKVVSFGLCYGMGAHGLARTLAISSVQAEALLTDYFKAFPKVKQYLDHTAETALKKGEVRTLAGRRLVLSPEMLNDVPHATRIAKNMPIQGTNADMIKQALAKMHQLLQSYEHAYIVHCVHDEMVVECHHSDAHSVQDMLEYAMRTAAETYIHKVPVKTESEITQVWD